MKKNGFYFSWPEGENVEVKAKIKWSRPSPRDEIVTSDEDKKAYFYAIIAKRKRKWCQFYIGIVTKQLASKRHTNQDHQNRMKELKKKHLNLTFLVSLGTPKLAMGKIITKKRIEDMESLLIYSNWHDDSINKTKFCCPKFNYQLHIINTGFNKHLHVESVKGVFHKDA